MERLVSLTVASPQLLKTLRKQSALFAVYRGARVLWCAVVLALVAVPRVLAQHVYQDTQIRFSVWASREAYPGYFEGDADEETQQKNAAAAARADATGREFVVPVARIKELAPYLLEGMVYGWRFEYTPSDKARGVEEYFAQTPVRSLTDAQLATVHYAEPWIQGERLLCWVEFERTDEMQRLYKSWQDIAHPRIRGVGYARLSEGFAGIEKACREALKNAVREYERKIIKTKPKEIDGSVIIAAPPLIGIDAGRYKVTLDFFMETDRIIEYKTF